VDNFRKVLGPGSDGGLWDVHMMGLNHLPVSDFRSKKCGTLPARQQASAVGKRIFRAMLIITSALGVERQLFAESGYLCFSLLTAWA
jgi:hypothetical protein